MKRKITPEKREVDIAYSPRVLRKRERSNNHSSTFAPATNTSTSYSRSDKYAPKTNNEQYIINKNYHNYSPSTEEVISTDYSPKFSYASYYKQKYAPDTEYETSVRYAPSIEDDFDYAPVFVTRFKPQPIVISNHEALDSYYHYIIQLLKVLR